jgi:hypothetical protein
MTTTEHTIQHDTQTPDVHTVVRKDLQVVSQVFNEYATTATALGWQPGRWPRAVQIVDSKNRPLYLVRHMAVLDDAHVYESVGGAARLTVEKD